VTWRQISNTRNILCHVIAAAFAPLLKLSLLVAGAFLVHALVQAGNTVLLQASQTTREHLQHEPASRSLHLPAR
jgi:hypothetical protein